MPLLSGFINPLPYIVSNVALHNIIVSMDTMIPLVCRIQRLEEFAGKVEKAQALAGDNPPAHLYNPVNAFQLVNRYSNGWMTLHDQLYEDNAKGTV